VYFVVEHYFHHKLHCMTEGHSEYASFSMVTSQLVTPILLSNTLYTLHMT
jgi:hypothetical protein